MKVLFSNPPWWEAIEGSYWRAGVRAGSRWPFTTLIASAPDKFKFGGYLPYPFFLGYAASWAKGKSGADVKLRDSIALRESYDSFFRYMADERFDLVFIESATPSWDHDQRVIAELKRRHPQLKVAVTGPIAGTLDESALDRLGLHACVRGEYEKGSVAVINGKSGIVDYDLLTADEMNAAPFPYFDEQIAHRYWDANPIGQSAPQLQMFTSRGCPYKCIFCVWPATITGNDPDGTRPRSVRQYSAAYVGAMIDELQGRYGFSCVYFDDDTFNLGNKHALEISAMMKKRGMRWSAMCRADTVRTETWRAMADGGCFGVKLGFESGNQHVVDNIVNKRLDLEAASETVFLLKSLGISVHGTFTYGLPGETREQMAETRRFIESLPFDSFQESGCAEIEGTPLHTLSKAGHLGKYSGAKMGGDYIRDPDGAKKLIRLSRIAFSK